MKTLVFEQYLPVTLDEAWEFFSSPSNLNLITPDQLKFKTISEIPKHIYKGLLIRYRIKPMMNVPLIWVTEITSIKEKEYFVDEQIKGPYKLWRHEHRFNIKENGVLITDILKYEIGFGILGALAGKLWVDRQVREIFSYRKAKLRDIFNRKNGLI